MTTTTDIIFNVAAFFIASAVLIAVLSALNGVFDD